MSVPKLPKCEICGLEVNQAVVGGTVNSDGKHWHAFCYKTQERMDQYRYGWDTCVERLKCAPTQSELDAHKATIAELVEALEECRDEIDGYIWQEYPSDNPLHERRRQRDFSANPARAALAKANGDV